MLVPLLGQLKQNEEELSEKVVRLNAMKSILGMCLNVNDSLNLIKVSSHSVFYYPTLIVKLKHKENKAERYLVINLVRSGLIKKHLSCDNRLTELCNGNKVCKEMLDGLLP
ncbi:hypothetical protein GTO27_11985 [Candidatus Bathyarchaeota archaeon]|nr:hypothetical protein [Candidatus Bathyarchaeota archaeon]